LVGDLSTGAGVAEAVRGAELVVHAATAARRDTWATDVEGTRRLVVAGRDAGVGHLLYVSIPGVDRIPLGYYRAKYAAEQIVAASALPYTVVRASQFHPLIGFLLRTAHRGPLLPVPGDWRVEPVAVRDVADHLTRRLTEPPAGAVEEFGGPETRDVADLARSWLAARGERGYVVPVVFPGGLSKAIRSGANLVASTAPRGTVTWSAWLASPDAAAEVAQYANR
jgi:uncharacterized protein YbjT (DUF2867 family)